MSDRPAQLMLVDPDPIFRLGLRIWLEQFADLHVAAEATTGTEALQFLARSRPDAADENPPIAPPLDLVLIDLALGYYDDAIAGFSLCQEIKQQFPGVAVLLLSDRSEPVLQAAARQAGADGYGRRSTPVDELEIAIRQVLAGTPYWPDLEPVPAAVLPPPPTAAPTTPVTTPAARLPRRPGPLQALRRRLHQMGLQEIDASLALVSAGLREPDLDPWTRAVLSGQFRELRTARWLVNQLLATPAVAEVESIPTAAPEPSPDQRPSSSAGRSPSREVTNLPRVIPRSETATQIRSLESLILDAAYNRLQGSLRNRTGLPLEMDILRPDRKRELLYTILRQFTGILAELRQSQVPPGQLSEQQDQLMRDLWATATTEFFGKYYLVRVGELEQEIVPLILQDEATVQIEILSQIPLVGELLAHLIYQTPLMVNGVLQPAGSPDAIAQAEFLLDHLLIQTANAVIQPLLNQFADVESIKRDFYEQRLLSTREIERFRNDLSWRYRLDQTVNEPKAIFESQYRLFTLSPRGILLRFIYAPRRQELERLSGLAYWVTFVLELRDAIAPRLRATISFLGSGVVYILRDLIGRGIGLVGRGILQGIGTAWQDSRFRNSERQQRGG